MVRFAKTWMRIVMHCCFILKCDGCSEGKLCSGCLSCAARSEFVKDVKRDLTWLLKLAYLLDKFNSLNSLNLSIQGGYTSILDASDKITALKKKKLSCEEEWKRESWTDFLHTNNLSVGIVKTVATSHLTALSQHFS